MADVACEGEGNGVAVCQCSDFSAGHVHGGNNHDNVTAQSVDVQVDGGTHHFGNVDLAVDAGLSQLNVLGTDAQNDILCLNVVGSQLSLLLFAQLDSQIADLSKILGYGISLALQPGLTVDDLDLLLS